jgi:hypothetical protein
MTTFLSTGSNGPERQEYKPLQINQLIKRVILQGRDNGENARRQLPASCFLLFLWGSFQMTSFLSTGSNGSEMQECKALPINHLIKRLIPGGGIREKTPGANFRLPASCFFYGARSK